MTLTPESKRGSDCSGSDGDTDRVLTLANEYLTQEGGFLVFLNGLSITPITEYTVSHLSEDSTITFLNQISDSDYIVLSYVQGVDTSHGTGYCSIAEIRAITDISINDVSDLALQEIIPYATKLLNGDVQIHIDDELVEYIDGEKENKIDGSNVTYYTKRTYIGDADDDGLVNTGGLYVYTLDSDGTRTTATITSIDDPRIGKFTLASAPSTPQSLYISYPVAPVNMQTDGLVKMACIYLIAALASTKLDAGQLRTYRVGKTYVSRETSKYADYLTKYKDLLLKIRRGTSFTADKTDAYI